MGAIAIAVCNQNPRWIQKSFIPPNVYTPYYYYIMFMTTVYDMVASHI